MTKLIQNNKKEDCYHFFFILLPFSKTFANNDNI